jgi:photosystem II stability/assembly factor-like uncharacterized protein
MLNNRFFGLIIGCLLTTISFAQGSWNTPANIGVSNYVSSQLNDVHFIDPNTAIAVGKEGTILKSDDGGLTWRGIISGTQNELNDVDFISSTEGLIVGTFGTILRTTDGGETWTSAINLGGSTYFYGVKMLNVNDAFAVGLIGAFFKTNDGGVTWTSVPIGSSSNFYSVDFLSATVGFAVGANGEMLKTIDAGNTWTPETSVTTNLLYKIKFFSATDGYAVGSTGTVLKTVNGGTNWTVESTGVSASLNDVHFYSATEGYAVGAFGTLLNTTDGGSSWVNNSSVTSKEITGVHFGNALNAIIVGFGGFVANTTNAGNVWDVTLNSDYATTELNSVSFPNPDKGWVAGNTGTIIHTSDKGLNWNAQNSGTTQNLHDIYFINDLNGWACGASGTNLSTVDGGLNWTINTALPSTLNAVHFCVCVTDGWVVGNGGTIYKTIDAGANWTPQTSGTAQTLNGVHFIDNINGWAVGNAGTILHSNDGGNTWVSQTSGISDNLKDVAFVSFLIGWATGENGTVLYTENAGSTWSLMNNNISGLSVNGISFLTQNSAWVGLNNGPIYKTKNKGLTWDFQSTTSSINIKSIKMNSFKEGCAVGSTGKIVLYRCGTPTPTGNAAQSFCFSASVADMVAQGENIIWFDQPSGGNVLSMDLPLQNGTTYYAAQIIDDCESPSRLAVTVTILNEGNPISATFTTQPSNCTSASGSASVAVSGGTSPYSYLWDNGSSLTQSQNLAAGLHYLTVEDNVGCTFLSSFQILSIGGPSVSLNSLTNNLCAKGTSGAIDINVSGGQTPYEFVWSNHQTTEDISTLPYGCYEVKVTDALGCVTSDNFFVDEPSTLYINYQVDQPTCLVADGSITIENGGGVAPYTYSWNIGATTMNLTSLVAGSYEVEVTDANSCNVTKQISLNDVEAEYVILEEMSIDDCSNNDASIFIYVSGVNNTYLWSDNSTDEDLLNVPFGEYTLEVTNDVGCKSFATYSLYPETTSLVGLCMVTVDEPTQHNILIWEKPSSGDIAFFNIYKESCLEGVYHLVHTQPYSDESLFEDSIANADVRGWRYKISTVNSCGDESELSDAHRTVQIMVLNNGVSYDIKWSEYEGLYIYTHDLYRSTTSLGEQLVGNFQTGQGNFTSDTPPATDDLKYYVVVDPFITCSSSRANINTSRSNTKGSIAAPTPDAINEVFEDLISIHPNPTNGLIKLVVPNDFLGQSVTISNVVGQTMSIITINSTSFDVDLTLWADGIYFIQVQTGGGLITKKIVKE